MEAILTTVRRTHYNHDLATLDLGRAELSKDTIKPECKDKVDIW